jgi:hypothetical protein
MVPVEVGVKKVNLKFSRAKWYEFEFSSNNREQILQRVEWCGKMFGLEPENFDAWCRWYTIPSPVWYTIPSPAFVIRFRFRDSKDYEFFVLRWS